MLGVISLRDEFGSISFRDCGYRDDWIFVRYLANGGTNGKRATCDPVAS
jgi:hypothetical protein